MSEVIPFKKPVSTNDLVFRFMHSEGHKKDAQFYLDLYAQKKPESFAIIILDEDTFHMDMDAVLFEIRYLMRLKLFPVLLISPTGAYMEKVEIENYFKKAKIAQNILSAEYDQEEKIDFIKQRVIRRELPVLHASSQIDLATQVTELANTLRTSKVIFVRSKGGLYHQHNKSQLTLVNLKFELDPLLDSIAFNQKDADLLSLSNQIITSCDHKVYISVVAPNNLLRELFTVKGAGTLIQLGSKINKLKNLENTDPKSLKNLLEMSFEKKIASDLLKESFDHVYLEENYMGAALLKDVNDMTYVSKFAVGTEARGLGIGRDIWQEITKNHKRIFWRSHPNRFITHWYIKQCEGMHRTKDWTIFWKGLPPNEVSQAIEYALEQKNDFE